MASLLIPDAPADEVASPFSSHSVFSDETEEGEYFDEENHGSSALEYSDDTQDSKTKFRMRRETATTSPSSGRADSRRHHRAVRFNENDKSKHNHQQRHHGNKHSINSRTSPSWMKRWAYSFRSPVVNSVKHSKQQDLNKPHHRRTGSAHMQEYPHNIAGIGGTTTMPPPPPPQGRYDSWESPPYEGQDSFQVHEGSPLLNRSFDNNDLNHRNGSILASTFLHDYEASRPPTFGSAIGITDHQLFIYGIKFSYAFEILQILAVLCLFVSSFLEKKHRTAVGILNFFSITYFAVDLYMKSELRTNNDKAVDWRNASSDSLRERNERHAVRVSRSEKLVLPMILFLVMLGLETIARLLLVDGTVALFASIFKPLVWFYVSSQARDALAAVRRILKIVVRVLVMELLLILMFAAVACRLFQDYEGFESLYVAWISLFELSTTVVNPSLWMPMYHDSKLSSIFFVLFIVVNVFYVHSLVLSVVFQTYIQAAAEIHERNSSDREDAVHLAFQALLQEEDDAEDRKDSFIDIQAVRETLQRMRPHYSPMKINALVEIVDPTNQGAVDFPTFRTKIRQALNASIRTPRNASMLAMSVELVAVAVAISNFAYVILLSSPYEEKWFTSIQLRAGCVITLVACFELLVRFNPFRIPDFTPLTRLNATFDGLALVAALVSSVGMVLFFLGKPGSLEYILMGRAIDMVRAMRFFQIFRDVVRRTSDVVPALGGPMILVATALHIFVYLGMALWSSSIEVGMHKETVPELYDLNNFNSYQEGVITMFQVLVVNDWYLVAEVFLYGTRRASPFIVYPFFIFAILVNVSVMLNVLTAFFVESFVTKLNDDKDAPAEATATLHKDREFHIQSSERNVRRVSSNGNLSLKRKKKSHDNSFDRGADADSEGSSESELFEFDVYEREGFDKIMRTVSGVQSIYEGDYAQRICSYLEIFESLSPGRETVGYLICDQQTMERFGNRRFRTKSVGFLGENKLHGAVTDMHAELLALAPKANIQERSLIRSFPHRRDETKKLEISAALLRRHPALSLFVSRTLTATPDPPNPQSRKR